MNAPVTDTSTPRLQAAFDPSLFAEAAQGWVAKLTGHLESLHEGQGRVLNWNEPGENVRLARQSLRSSTDAANGEHTIADRFADLVATTLERGHNLHHPHYIGHQVAVPVPLAGLAQSLAAVTNSVMAIYEVGPWVTGIEKALVGELGERIGWPADSFAGLITNGGSLGNLTALLTARNVALSNVWESGLAKGSPPPVIVAHRDAHYCVARAGGILGLGTEQVHRADLDDRRRLDPQALDCQLQQLQAEGHSVVAVAACASATPIGAFDPLPEIAAVCRKYGVWLHVDAAHGGATLFSRKHRHLVDGLEQADSVVIDAHKMLLVPALCAFVLYRNREHRFEAFRQNAPYLFDPSDPGAADYDVGLQTVECTKQASGFGLWVLWSLFGPELFEEFVDTVFAQAREFHGMLCEADDFETMHEPQANILVFRHLPAWLRGAAPEAIGRFQLETRKRLVRSGTFYLVPTQSQGYGALRVTVMNPLTTRKDFEELMGALRAFGEEVRNSCGPW